MQIKVAPSAGFCFGVQRAVDRVYGLIGKGGKPVYTLGPVIHNEDVVRDLEKKGVHAIEESELDSLLPGTTVVIRSHGVGKKTYERLERQGLICEDVTCPFVKKIHKIVEEQSRAGKYILIIGDPAHAEVKGICGWVQGSFSVISSSEEAEAFVPPEGKKVCVVSQTTFHYNKFKDIVEILRKKSYSKNVIKIPDCFDFVNTICSATEERQKDARQIAAASDTMLVIGGRHSSNTQKLYEICRQECENTYYIQTPVDLDSDMFQRSSYVGITAGASTPKKIIEEVLTHVRKIF